MRTSATLKQILDAKSFATSRVYAAARPAPRTTPRPINSAPSARKEENTPARRAA